MPRIANSTDSLIADLTRRLQALADTARKEGRADALAEVRALVGGGAPGAAPGRPGRKAGSKPAKPAKAARAKSKKPRKNPWASMTPAQKQERVRKMLAGRGLKPVAERGAAKPARRKSTRRRSK